MKPMLITNTIYLLTDQTHTCKHYASPLTSNLNYVFPFCVWKKCKLTEEYLQKPFSLNCELRGKERILAPHNGRKNPKYPKQTSSLPCRTVLPCDLSPLSSSSGKAPSSSLSPLSPFSLLFVSRQQGNGGLSKRETDREIVSCSWNFGDSYARNAGACCEDNKVRRTSVGAQRGQAARRCEGTQPTFQLRCLLLMQSSCLKLRFKGMLVFFYYFSFSY